MQSVTFNQAKPGSYLYDGKHIFIKAIESDINPKTSSRDYVLFCWHRLPFIDNHDIKTREITIPTDDAMYLEMSAIEARNFYDSLCISARSNGWKTPDPKD